MKLLEDSDHWVGKWNHLNCKEQLPGKFGEGGSGWLMDTTIMNDIVQLVSPLIYS
jgi:hypothetical protein